MSGSNKKKDLEFQLIQKAWKDKKFREELLLDPKAAIQKELQVVIPDGVEIKVIQETANTFYLVIPEDPSIKSASGAKDDLEAVAYD